MDEQVRQGDLSELVGLTIRRMDYKDGMVMELDDGTVLKAQGLLTTIRQAPRPAEGPRKLMLASQIATTGTGTTVEVNREFLIELIAEQLYRTVWLKQKIRQAIVGGLDAEPLQEMHNFTERW